MSHLKTSILLCSTSFFESVITTPDLTLAYWLHQTIQPIHVANFKIETAPKNRKVRLQHHNLHSTPQSYMPRDATFSNSTLQQHEHYQANRILLVREQEGRRRRERAHA